MHRPNITKMEHDDTYEQLIKSSGRQDKCTFFFQDFLGRLLLLFPFPFQWLRRRWGLPFLRLLLAALLPIALWRRGSPRRPLHSHLLPRLTARHSPHLPNTRRWHPHHSGLHTHSHSRWHHSRRHHHARRHHGHPRRHAGGHRHARRKATWWLAAEALTLSAHGGGLFQYSFAFLATGNVRRIHWTANMSLWVNE